MKTTIPLATAREVANQLIEQVLFGNNDQVAAAAITVRSHRHYQRIVRLRRLSTTQRPRRRSGACKRNIL